jgi:acyl-coenzyme A thioesterase PaaI-like protein
MDRHLPFQDQIPDNLCYGCGPGNEHGLRIKSYWEGAESVSTFVPQPFHAAGPAQFLNGGVTATIVDCHCVCTAVADHYRREDRAIGTMPLIWCVTASLKIEYFRPVLINKPVTLRARIINTDGKKTKLSCSVLSGNQECASGEVLAIRVPPGWREPK